MKLIYTFFIHTDLLIIYIKFDEYDLNPIQQNFAKDQWEGIFKTEKGYVAAMLRPTHSR